MTWVPSGVRLVPDCPKTWAVYQMGPMVKELIHTLKYQDYAECAPYMARQFLKWSTGNPFRKALNCDWILPVPLHRVRQRERGFNQSGKLIGALSRSLVLPLPVKPLLNRKRFTPSQTRLDENQRQANLASAFECPRPDFVKDKSILLIDDVTTTGSTLAACARTLKSAGARQVQALVWAWVPKQNTRATGPARSAGSIVGNPLLFESPGN